MSTAALQRTSRTPPARASKSASRENFRNRTASRGRSAAYAFVASRDFAYAYEKPRQDRQSLQIDPVGYADGLNWYAYVRNDPVNAIVPSGLLSNCNLSASRCEAVLKAEEKAVGMAKELRDVIADSNKKGPEGRAAQSQLDRAFKKAFGTIATASMKARADKVLAAGIKASDESTYTYVNTGGSGGHLNFGSKAIAVGVERPIGSELGIGNPRFPAHELLGHGGTYGALGDGPASSGGPIRDGRLWNGTNPYDVQAMAKNPDVATRNAANYECFITGGGC